MTARANTSSGSGVPSGGSTGQVLKKNSNTDGDASWAADSTIPTGGSTGQVLKKNSNTDGDASWAADTNTNRLQDLTDVDASVLTDGRAVAYDSASGKFKGTLPTKRVTLPISSDTSGSQSGFADMAQRFYIDLPVTTTRWRLKIRNTGNAGAITLADIYLGTPSLTASNWLGANTATGTAALTGLSMTSDGSEYTTGWVTDATLQFPAHTPKTITVGNTQSSGLALLKSSNYTSIVFTGAGAAASVANATLTGSPTYNAQFLDIRLEYEFQGHNLVVLCLGDSITSGLFDALTPNIGSPSHLWSGLAARRNNACWINLSGQGHTTGAFSSSGASQYARIDLATTVPDAAIIGLGINDANAGTSLASYQSGLQSVVNTLRGFGIKRIFIATNIPQPRWKAGRITTAVASGVTSFATDFAYAAGDVIDIDYGLSGYEQRTVDSGGSTGTTVPYTTPVTVATSNAHGVGAHVCLAQESKRRSYNEWIGQGVPYAEGVFDFARAVSSYDNPYAGAQELYSTGTIHPGRRAHEEMARTVTIGPAPGNG